MKKDTYTLMDVSRMLVSIPLTDDARIDEAKLIIKYRGSRNFECEYISELPKNEKQNNEDTKGNKPKRN